MCDSACASKSLYLRAMHGEVEMPQRSSSSLSACTGCCTSERRPGPGGAHFALWRSTSKMLCANRDSAFCWLSSRRDMCRLWYVLTSAKTAYLDRIARRGVGRLILIVSGKAYWRPRFRGGALCHDCCFNSKMSWISAYSYIVVRTHQSPGTCWLYLHRQVGTPYTM